MHIYRTFLCPEYGIDKPPTNLRLWVTRASVDNDTRGSTPMARQISINTSTLLELLAVYNINKYTKFILLVMPDVFLFKNYTSTKTVYSLVFHELAHASHYTKVGKGYWLKFIVAIVSNNGYGNGTGLYSGHIGVGEVWANYFGNYVCCKKQFGYPVFWDEYEGWYKPGILKRLDYKYNFGSSQLFTCLKYNITDHQKLKNELISNYGKEKQIKEAFSKYGF